MNGTCFSPSLLQSTSKLMQNQNPQCQLHLVIRISTCISRIHTTDQHLCLATMFLWVDPCWFRIQLLSRHSGTMLYQMYCNNSDLFHLREVMTNSLQHATTLTTAVHCSPVGRVTTTLYRCTVVESLSCLVLALVLMGHLTHCRQVSVFFSTCDHHYMYHYFSEL